MHILYVDESGIEDLSAGTPPLIPTSFKMA
jgi:hypothetical protein